MLIQSEETNVPKMSGQLRQEVEVAEPSQILRVIVSLDVREMPDELKLNLADLPDHRASRRSLIVRRSNWIKSTLADTIDCLRQLSMNFAEDTVRPSIALEITAENLVQALELTRVTFADIDRPLHELSQVVSKER